MSITIQREQPQDVTPEANWLSLTLRIGWPEQAALDGSWTPPSIRRAN